MIYKYSKIDPEKLLHLITRCDEIEGRTDVAPASQFIQLATLRMEKGKTFRPHKHIWKPASKLEVIAQESWVVIKGSVKVHLYDIDSEWYNNLSSDDLVSFFEFVESTQHLIAVSYNSWKEEIWGTWEETNNCYLNMETI